jgi:hypothetical protein
MGIEAFELSVVDALLVPEPLRDVPAISLFAALRIRILLARTR